MERHNDRIAEARWPERRSAPCSARQRGVARRLAESYAAQATSDHDAPVVTLTEARRAARVGGSGRRGSDAAGSTTAGWERRAALVDLFTPDLTADLNYIHFSDPFFNFGTGAISPNAAAATLEASYTSSWAPGSSGQLKSSRASLESAEANETATRFQYRARHGCGVFRRARGSRAGARGGRPRQARRRAARGRAGARRGWRSDRVRFAAAAARGDPRAIRAPAAAILRSWRRGFALDSRSGCPVRPTRRRSTRPCRRRCRSPRSKRSPSCATRGPDVEAARADERRADAALSRGTRAVSPGAHARRNDRCVRQSSSSRPR